MNIKTAAKILIFDLQTETKPILKFS